MKATLFLLALAVVAAHALPSVVAEHPAILAAIRNAERALERSAPRRTLLSFGPPLRIGLLHPYVNSTASNEGTLGQTITDINAAYMAIADLGAKAQVVVMPNGCDNAKVNATIKEMVDKYKVVAILGPVCSGTVLAAAPLLDELKLPAMAYSAGAQAVSFISPYVYRTALSPFLASNPLADLMRMKFKTAVIIRDGALLSRDYARITTNLFSSTNDSSLSGTAGRVLAELAFDGALNTTADMENLVKQALDLKPDVIFYMVSFLATNPALTTAMVKAARASNAELPIIYGNAFHPQTITELKAAGLLKGIIQQNTQVYSKADARFDTAFGYPLIPTAYSTKPETGVYSGASAIIKAARDSGKRAPSASDIQARLSMKGFTFKAWGDAVGKFEAGTGDLLQDVTVTITDATGNTSPYSG